MKLYLIRHGETDVNRLLNHGITGPIHNEPITFKEGDSTNIGLNISGRTHAEEAGKLLPDNITTIYASPLLRVKETAEIIARVKGIDPLNIITCAELREYNMGKLEGLSTEKKIEIAGGRVWGSGLLCNYDYTKWGGDSWKTLYDRLYTFFNELKKNNPEDEIRVCVTSTGVIRMAYKIFLSDKAPDITQFVKIENGSVHTFII